MGKFDGLFHPRGVAVIDASSDLSLDINLLFVRAAGEGVVAGDALVVLAGVSA